MNLQFQTAEPATARCVVCKQPIASQYYHAQGQVVCPLCANRIQSGQQSPPPVSLVRAAIYGAGAALAGCLIYSLVAMLGVEIGLIAILVGWMVGKTIRYASHGLGGRPQQIMAVLLTYFAITTSYVAVAIYHSATSPARAVQQQEKAQQQPATEASPVLSQPKSAGGMVVFLLLLAAAAPFLQLTSSGVSGLISLFIIFIGLRQAWTLTARTELVVMGPYETAPSQ